MPSSSVITVAAPSTLDRHRHDLAVEPAPRRWPAPPAAATRARTRRGPRARAPTSRRSARPRCPAARGRDSAPTRRGPNGSAAEHRRAHRHPAHALDAGRDHDVVRARDHALGGEVQRPVATTRTAGRRWCPAPMSGNPAASSALRPMLNACSPTCETQPMITSSTTRGVEVVALHERVEHVRGEVDGVPSREPAVAPPERGADGVDDHGGRHGHLPGAARDRNVGRADSLAPVRNLDRSLGDGGMPLLGQLGRVLRALRRGLGRGDVVADRARGQPVRRRARRRVRRDPRRGDELRRQQRTRVRGPGRHARRVVPDPARATTVGDRLAVRGEVVQLTRQVAYVESTVRDADDGVVSRRWARSSCGARRSDHHRRRARSARTGPSRGASTTAGSSSCSPASGIYLVYDWLRDKTTGTSAAAYRHALQIVDAEQFLGLYHEHSIQQAFLHVDWFMSFWNIYYGTIHFVMPVVALVWLYRKAPVRYVRWRNTMVLMLAISIVVFWLYPLMPPRLMPARYGFVDAAARYFNFGPQVHVHFDARRPAVRRGRPRLRQPLRGHAEPPRRAGRRGRSLAVVAARPPHRGRRCSGRSTRSASSSASSSPPTTGSSTRSAAGWCSALGYLGALGVERLLARRRHRSSITG